MDAPAYIPPHLTEDEAAEYLRLSPRSLQRYRIEGTGPAFVRMGRRIAYRRSDLDAWVASRVFTSTSEADACLSREAAA